MDEMQYALLTEVMGRWKADIIENLLREKGIDPVVIHDTASDLYTPSFTAIKIYVPKASIRRARDLLNTFNDIPDKEETRNMANKKKIEEREKMLRAKQTERVIQLIGLAVVVVLVIAGVWFFSSDEAEPAQTTLDYGDATACERFADIPVAAQYVAPPQAIDVNMQYFATVRMENGGEFVIQLYPDKAPITVNSFIFLACKGYFNGLTFHRVLDGFMAQGGDPEGTGGGGPGYQFVNEDSDLTFDKAGVVAMANAGRDTNGSQFFITFGPQEFLNGGYTIFGQVVEGMDVVNGITRRDPDENPTFAGDAMESVTITEN